MLKFIKFVVMAFGALVLGTIVLFVAAVWLSDDKKDGGKTAPPLAQQNAPAPQRQQPVLKDISAQDLAEAYHANTVAADQQFKGKRYRVSGRVVEISTDFMGDPYITLQGGVNEFMEPQFQFSKQANNALAKLKKGAFVILECTGGGDIAKTPMSRDCELQ